MTDDKLNELLRKLTPRIEDDLAQRVRPCPSADHLQAFIEERLPPDQAREIAHHLLACAVCADTVTAWDAVCEEDEQRAAFEAGQPRRRAAWPRLAVAAAAAAAVVLFILTVPFRGEPGFSVTLADATGPLRSPVLRADQAIELRLTLPHPVHVYVFAFEEAGPELLHPAPEQDVPLDGFAVVPGGGTAWKLTDAPAGKHLLLVGIRRSPLPAGERDGCAAALSAVADRFAEDALRAAVKDRFEEMAFVRFTVVR